MNLQEYINNTIKASRAESFGKSDQLTLGEIILKCEAISEKNHVDYDGNPPSVGFDFEYLRPTTLDSWRGSYDELALGFSIDAKAPQLPDFIEMLIDAIGETFHGWKGGEYTMSKNTPVWVANSGNAGTTAIIEVIDNEYEVILVTGIREY